MKPQANAPHHPRFVSGPHFQSPRMPGRGGHSSQAVSDPPADLWADPFSPCSRKWGRCYGSYGFYNTRSVRTKTCFLCSSYNLSPSAKHAAEVRMSYFLVSIPTSGSFNEDLIILCGLTLCTRASWKYKNVTWACLHLGNPCWSDLV